MSFNTVRLDETDQRRINVVLRNTVEGKTNNTGTVTLTANATTTVVADLRVGADSVLVFMPITSNASLENMYVRSQGKQTFTITHNSDAFTDKTFKFIVVG